MTTPARYAVVFLLIPSLALGLIGFDCHHKDVKIRPISLAGVAPCPDYKPSATKTEATVQLIQQRQTNRVYYRQCSVTYLQQISYCGMHSHISAVAGGLSEGFRHVGRVACMDLHQLGMLPWDNEVVIRKVPTNSTSRFHLTIAGKLNTEGSCSGAHFVDNGRDYDSVIVQVSVKITLKDGWTAVNLDEKLLQLPSGGVVSYQKGETLDFIYGNTYWEVTEQGACNKNHYHVLYEGPAIILSEPIDSHERRIVVVESSDQTFSLEILSSTLLCAQASFHTENPRLYIIILTPGIPQYFQLSGVIDPLDISLTTYVNSKFVYVERHIRAQIESLYSHVMTQSCSIARQGLLNTLSLAFINEEEFAYTYTGEKGHTAVRRGEVINLIDCIAVPVTVRHTDRCFSDLPVTYKNMTKFLSPKSAVLKSTGTEVECSPILPVWYHLEDGWYNVYGGPMTGTFAPHELTPMQTPQWKYISPSDLATRGLYTREEMARLETQLLYPGEREAALNIIGREYIGQSMLPQGRGVGSLLSAGDLESISSGVFKEMWGMFGIFGSYASGFVGIYIILRAIKLLLNSVINGAMLYQVFGFSMKLVACVWSNATSLLLHKHTHSSRPTYHTSKNKDLEDGTLLPLESVTQEAPAASAPDHWQEITPQKPITVYPPLPTFHPTMGGSSPHDPTY